MIKVLYHCFENGGKTYDELSPLLSRQRRNCCEKSRDEKARLRSAYAYILLKKGIKELFGINSEPEFIYGEHGKPYLKQGGIFFSMSHAGSSVICAFSEASEIGADIQDIRSISDGAAKKFCTAEEYEKISALPPEEHDKEFCRIWCIKESKGKCTGKGFSEGFSGFSADELLSNGEAAVITHDNMFIGVCLAAGTFPKIELSETEHGF